MDVLQQQKIRFIAPIKRQSSRFVCRPTVFATVMLLNFLSFHSPASYGATCLTAGDTSTLTGAITSTCFISSTVAPFNNLTVTSTGSIIVPFSAVSGALNTAVQYNNTTFPVTNGIINNQGLISATFYGLNLTGSAATLTAGNSIINSGTINAFGTDSTTVGLNIAYADNTTITNSGSLLNTGGAGNAVQILLSNNTTISNTGTISAPRAIAAYGATNFNLSNSASSNILGGITLAPSLSLVATTIGTINNAGTISASSSADAALSTLFINGDLNGQLINDGTITVNDLFTGTATTNNSLTAIFANSVSGTLTNNAIISVTTTNASRDAVAVLIKHLTATAQLNNSGTISVSDKTGSGSRTALAITGFESGATLNNTGTINSVLISGGLGDKIFNLTGQGNIASIFGALGGGNKLNFTGNVNIPSLTSQFASTSSSANTTINLGAGNSTIDGDLSLGDNNSLNVTLNADGSGGKLKVLGAAIIPTSTKVAVTATIADSYTDGFNYIVVDAGIGSNIEQPSTVSTNHLAFEFQAVVSADKQDLLIKAVELNASNSPVLRGLNDQGTAINQSLISSDILTDLTLNNALKQAQNSSSSAYQSALDSLQPEHSSAVADTSAAINRSAIKTITNRLTSLRTSVSGLSSGEDYRSIVNYWLQAFGSDSQQKNTATISGFDANSAGLMVGADVLINDVLKIGAALSYANTDIDGNNSAFDNKVDSYQGSLYASYYQPLAAQFDLILSYGQHHYDQQRYININGVIRDPQAKFSGDQWSIKTLYGRELAYANDLFLTPKIGLYYSNLALDSYSEKQGGGANLHVDSNRHQILESIIGLSLRKEMTANNDMIIVPELHANWRHDFLAEKTLTASRFTGGDIFTTAGSDAIRDSYNIGATLTAYIEDNIDISARYDYDTNKDSHSHSALLSVQMTTDNAFAALFSPLAVLFSPVASNTKSQAIEQSFDMEQLFPISLDTDLDKISGPNIITEISDYRYSTLRLHGRQIDSSSLGYSLADPLSSVSTYLGNTPIFTNTGLADFDHINYFERLDVNKIEILTGVNSQFGNTALGGIVQYSPNKPILGDLSGSVAGSVNDLQGANKQVGYSANFTLNLPLFDQLAARFTAGHITTAGSSQYANLYRLDSDGAPIDPTRARNANDFFAKDDVNEFDSSFGRASLLWRPNHKVETLLMLAYQNDKRGGARINTLGLDGFNNDYGFNQSGALIQEPRQRKTLTSSLNIHIEQDDYNFNSNTAHYSHTGSFVDDFTGLAANNSFLLSGIDYCENTPGVAATNQFNGETLCFATPYSQFSQSPLVVSTNEFDDQGFSQEFKLASTINDKLDYNAGLYFHDRQRDKLSYLDKPGFMNAYANSPSALLPNPQNIINSDRIMTTYEKFESTEIALYGNLNYQHRDDLRGGLGLKAFYHRTETKVSRQFPMFNTASLAGGIYSTDSPQSLRFGSLNDQFKTHKIGFLPSLQLEYDVSEQQQLYINFDQGFRSGGLNNNAISSANDSLADRSFRSYDDETSYNFHYGLRGRNAYQWGSFKPSIHYDLGLFSRFADDQQISSFTYSRDPRSQLASNVIINADKAQQHGIELKLHTQLTNRWAAAIDYTWLHTAKLTADVDLPASVLHDQSANGGTRIDSATLANSGSRLPLNPKHSVVLKTNYFIPMGNKSVNLYASSYIQSSMNLSIDDKLSSEKTKSYATLNLGLTYSHDNMEVTVFANNVTNVKGSNFRTPSPSGPATNINYLGSSQSESITQPRLIGINFNYRF